MGRGKIRVFYLMIFVLSLFLHFSVYPWIVSCKVATSWTNLTLVPVWLGVVLASWSRNNPLLSSKFVAVVQLDLPLPAPPDFRVFRVETCTFSTFLCEITLNSFISAPRGRFNNVRYVKQQPTAVIVQQQPPQRNIPFQSVSVRDHINALLVCQFQIEFPIGF